MRLVEREIIETRREEETARPEREQTPTTAHEDLETLEQGDQMTVMRPVIVVATTVLWCVLVVLSVASIWGPGWQDRFFNSATKVLLPLFNATIASSLGYVFGKPVVKAIAQRLYSHAQAKARR